MHNYNINIFYSEEDGGYIADIPDLKFCSAFGETPEKALYERVIAKQLWLEEAKESGMKIPEAKYKPMSKGKIICLNGVSSSGKSTPF